MITADFYPTQTTQFNTQYTDTILNLNYTDPEKIAAPYYMGYINYDDIPSALKASYCKFVYSDTEAYVEFSDITNVENVPWFFTGFYATNSNTTQHAYYRLNTNTNKYMTNSDMYGMGHWGFLNSLQIERVSYRQMFSLTFTIQFLNMSTNPPVYDSNTYVDADTKAFSSYADLNSFLTNETPISFTYTKYGETYTAEIYARDIESGYYEITTPGGYLWRFYLTDFTNFYSERDIQPNGNYANYSNIGVGTLMHYNHPDKGVIPLLNNLFSWHYPPAENRYINIVFNATTQDAYNGRWIDSWTALGGFQCKIPYAFFLNAANYQVARFGNCIIAKMGYNINYLKRVFTLNEVLKTYVFMFTRLSTTATTSYGFNDDMKIPLFNDDNSPMWDYVSGELEDIQSQLQPWQYTNITTNTFTEYDIPDYHPPEPTPGGDDNSETGDKIPNQFGRNVGVTSNFITQYLMTQGQISKLGEVLWTSWADDTVTMDMVENFYGKLHDSTGSWNVSSALQFLVSCRMFPMSLATLVGTTATTSIPIGTGAFALQCGTASEPTFFIANESVAVLNCGDVYVPKEFGDYRDFDNTNITAYLPYCGSVQLSPQDVVGKWLGCTYAIDLFDGSCKAFMYTLSGDDVGYQGAYYNVAIKEGQCGFLIPMSATQAGEVASRRKVDSYVDGSMLFNAGATMLDGTMRIASGDGLGAIGADVGRLANLGFAYNTLSAQRMGRAGIAAPTIAGGSGFADFMQPASPYIQIRRSRYQMPIQYENSAAYPTNAQNYGNLSQFTGFVQCKNVDVHGFTCHEEERSAIKALLESGVYL